MERNLSERRRRGVEVTSPSGIPSSSHLQNINSSLDDLVANLRDNHPSMSPTKMSPALQQKTGNGDGVLDRKEAAAEVYIARPSPGMHVAQTTQDNAAFTPPQLLTLGLNGAPQGLGQRATPGSVLDFDHLKNSVVRQCQEVNNALESEMQRVVDENYHLQEQLRQLSSVPIRRIPNAQSPSSDVESPQQFEVPSPVPAYGTVKSAPLPYLYQEHHEAKPSLLPEPQLTHSKAGIGQMQMACSGMLAEANGLMARVDRLQWRPDRVGNSTEHSGAAMEMQLPAQVMETAKMGRRHGSGENDTGALSEGGTKQVSRMKDWIQAKLGSATYDEPKARARGTLIRSTGSWEIVSQLLVFVEAYV